MRDLVLAPVILGLAAYGLLHPWFGIVGWTWISISIMLWMSLTLPFSFYTVRDLPGVERFRIEQLSVDQTIVKVLARPAFGTADEVRIIRDFKARLGEAVDVRADRVSDIDIANESSGKFRCVVHQVKAFGVNKGANNA